MQSKKDLREMNRVVSVILVVIVMAASLSGCSRTMGQRDDPVTDTARRAAVLSLHQRTSLNGHCRFGLTLTNNLNVEVRDLVLKFTAYSENDARLQSVTRGFFGIRPTLQQFAEIIFAFQCSRIQQIQVGGFGRCMVGELTLRSTQPGSCLNLVDVRQSRFVELIKAEDDSN